MANWWGGMTGSQAVEMGMNVFNAAQKQMAMKQEQERIQQQQQMENLFNKQRLQLQQENINLQKERQRFERERIKTEQERRAKEFEIEVEGRKKELEFKKQQWQEQLGFKRETLEKELAFEKEKMAMRLGEKPNLAEYPLAIKQAIDLYEQTGNWGIVQSVQKQYGMPIDKTPGKITEMKEAANVWKFADQQGLPLIVDRKLGFGGEEMALPYEVVKRYGADSLDALKQISGVLGADKYKQYTISQLYEIFFRARRFKKTGYTNKEIITAMQEAKLPEDLISDIIDKL